MVQSLQPQFSPSSLHNRPSAGSLLTPISSGASFENCDRVDLKLLCGNRKTPFLTRIFMDVLLELMVSQVILVEWRDDKNLKQKRAFNFLFEKFKTFYMPVSH